MFVFVIGLVTLLLLLDCFVLILLVLMQLPKKEAGAGLAFGGAATDALFGAGSGNFLTKATKYVAGGFFVLTLLLAVMQNHYAHRPNSQFRRMLERQAQAVPAASPDSAQPAAAQSPAPGTPVAGAAPSTNIGILPLNTAPANTPAGTNSGQ
ncbi:MAG TPA: preprotein translocase subunit SecG [Verrucomicrobiae bacterium]|nr:preprotein translocase subunit SecG [Verrucomicrobiae bacterium]